MFGDVNKVQGKVPMSDVSGKSEGSPSKGMGVESGRPSVERF